MKIILELTALGGLAIEDDLTEQTFPKDMVWTCSQTGETSSDPMAFENAEGAGENVSFIKKGRVFTEK